MSIRRYSVPSSFLSDHDGEGHFDKHGNPVVVLAEDHDLKVSRLMEHIVAANQNAACDRRALLAELSAVHSFLKWEGLLRKYEEHKAWKAEKPMPPKFTDSLVALLCSFESDVQSSAMKLMADVKAEVDKLTPVKPAKRKGGRK